MDEIDLNERLHEIGARFGGAKPLTILGRAAPPFDITKPNIHDTKSEFLDEKDFVAKAAQASRDLFELIVSGYKDEDPLGEVSSRVSAFVDREVRRSTSKEPLESPVDLVQRNASEIGATFSAAIMLAELATAFEKRKQELSDQEAEFWSGHSRPPNHYARTIALRFARYVAEKIGDYPTVGTSRDGAHPSTDFGRALEEIFQLLGINANFRRAAEWAVEQLTEDDLNRRANILQAFAPKIPPSGLANIFQGPSRPSPKPTDN